MNSRSETLYFSSPVWLQNIMVSAMGYKLYRKRYTGVYHELLELVRESQGWSAERRSEYQSEQLHEIVKHCRLHVPYYQKLFADHGLHENHITSLSDLDKIPILDKQTVQKRAKEFLVPGVKPYMVQHTSGSTGTPLTIHVNEITYKLAMALLVDHEEYHGISFGARRATFAGRMLKRSNDMTPPFSRFNQAENQKLYSSYHLNKDTFKYYHSDLFSFSPEEIIGYPSAISDLANYYIYFENSNAPTPRAIITNSETLLEWQRVAIEKVFGCNIYDYYGTAEYVLFAAQRNTNTYTVNPLIGIVQSQHIEGSLEINNLVATTLTNTTMPLLRYRLGDLGSASTFLNEDCNVVSTLKRIEGRKDDYIELPDGRRIGRMDHIFKDLRGIKEAQIIQNSENHCTVKIVSQGYDIEVLEKHLKENFNKRTNGLIELDIEYTDHIPRSSNGKFKGVLRKL